MDEMTKLGFQLTHSGPAPGSVGGAHWVHFKQGKRVVYGFGADETSAVASALAQAIKPWGPNL